jgi:hypothetical protein
MTSDGLEYFKSKGTVIYLEPLEGASLEDCALEAALLSWDLDTDVLFVFDGVVVDTTPGYSPDDVVERYQEKAQGDKTVNLHPSDCGCTDCCIGKTSPTTE